MNEVYVHTLRYHYSGRGNRQSRTMFPISYGPFRDEEAAREWIRQRGMTRATKLLNCPALENIKIAPGQQSFRKMSDNSIFMRIRKHQKAMHSKETE